MLTFKKLGHYGRLGNQMFQYAALVGIATKHDYSWGYDPENEINGSGSGYNERMELRDAFTGISNYAQKEIRVHKRFIEPDKDFTAGLGLLESCEDGIDLLGYFQSEKYFSHCAGDIRAAFTFQQWEASKATTLLNIICKTHFGGCTPENLVSIHIRRGDYIQLSHVLPPQTEEYYKEAIEQFPSDAKFVLFGSMDDWTKDVFSRLLKDRKFITSYANEPAVDMKMMTLCRGGNIIANSSFSWWGAWLRENQNAKVVAPRNWFGPAGPTDWSNIYCAGWTVV